MSDEQPRPSTPLIEFLRDAAARCPMCRYHLRGIESDRCPECGYELSLAIARPAYGFGWWLAGILGLACTCGLLFLILLPSIPRVAETVNNPDLVALVRGGFVSASELPNWRAIFPLSATLLMCLGLMGVIIGSRRRLVTWPRLWQIVCGLFLLLTPMIALILIAALT